MRVVVRLRTVHALGGLCALVALSCARNAVAQSAGGFWYETPAAAPTSADQGTTDTETTDTQTRAPARVERPFLYLVDPTLPRPMHVIASYSAGYSSADAATRPLAATEGRGGLVNELRLEGGLHERLAPFVTGMLAPPTAGEQSARTALQAGFRVLVTDPSSQGFRLALSAAYDRDFRSTNGAFARVTASYDVGRLRLASMVHTEKMFSADRDQIDLYAVAGTSYRVLDSLRVGAEYVAQDIEGAWEAHETEGGIRHFVGADLAWSFEQRLLLTAGPAFGLGSRSPRLLGRASLAYLF